VEVGVEVETVVEAAGCHRRDSALSAWDAGDEAFLAVEKGCQSAVVMSIERRRPFIGGDDARRGGKR
jgi:hypothetical protein